MVLRKLKMIDNQSITVKRTDSGDHDFIDLVSLLDRELALVDKEDHSFYSQFNKIDKIKYVILIFDNEKPVGCGAIKEFGSDSMEVKRMFVLPVYRNRGLATVVLNELEKWSRDLQCTNCILETGKRQPDAIRLYTKNGYKQIPNYGQYTGVENSVCFEKQLI